jgi:hypothetical protein
MSVMRSIVSVLRNDRAGEQRGARTMTPRELV